MKYLPLLTALLCTPLAASAADGFVPAAAPAKAAKPSPLSGEEERATFTLPPGFEIKLVGGGGIWEIHHGGLGSARADVVDDGV